MQKQLDRINSLLSYYEKENKRTDKFLLLEREASMSLTNIEHDVLKFLAKGKSNEKSEERMDDIEKIRMLVEYSSVCHLRVEQLIRLTDNLRSLLIKCADEKKKIQDDYDKFREEVHEQFS